MWFITWLISGFVITRVFTNGFSKIFYVTVDPEVSQVNCTGDSDTFRCHSLQSALLLTALAEHGYHYKISFSTSVPYDFVHLITEPILTGASVTISGNNRSGVVIACDISQTFIANWSNDLKYLLYFNLSHTVDFHYAIFQYCPLPIRVLQAEQVLINNSTFRYFEEAVFDIHNSYNVTLLGSFFLNNIGTGITQKPYRGNTGALSITYNHVEPGSIPGDPVITVNSCFFINNSATAETFFKSANQVFGKGILTGRGGAMAVFVRENNYNISVRTADCTFTQNSARSYAGAVYYLFNGLGHHTGSVSSSFYESNFAGIGGGGQILVGTKGLTEFPHVFSIENCTFLDNKATVGAGLYYSINLDGGRSNRADITNSRFINNLLLNQHDGFGVAIAADIADDYQGKDSFPINTISNCLIANNTAGASSIVSLGFQTFHLYGINTFIGNQGSSLRVINARIIISGTIEFIRNMAMEGAALYLLLFSQVQLSDNVYIVFEGNKGRYGASIFAGAFPLLQAFQQIPYNPQCFFMLNSSKTLPPSRWNEKNVTIEFKSNSAWFGSALYATSFAACSWSNNQFTGSFEYSSWPIFVVSDDNENSAFTDRYNQINSFVTESVQLNVSDSNLSGWPGQKLSISLIAVDELAKATGSLIRFDVIPNATQIHKSSIIPVVVLIKTQSLQTNFTFQFSSVDKKSIPVNDTLGTIVLTHEGTVTNTRDADKSFITLHYTDCAAGYSLNAHSCECDDKSIKEILSCDSDQDLLIIKSGLWAVKVKGEPASLYFQWCPTGYCRCYFNSSVGDKVCASVYSNSNPDMQCACSRKGILCGECKEGGVSTLLNECVSCSNVYLVFIPLLILLDVLVMLVIIILPVRVPEWSYPFLYYIQIVPIISLNFPPSFTEVGKYLYYVSSAIGFYFAYDFCLMSKLATATSYFLRHIPFIVAIILISTILLLKRKCHRLKMLLKQTDGVWTVVLLSYTHVTYTSLSVLNCPRIPKGSINYPEAAEARLRWFFDGNVVCFSGEHIGLSVISLISLLFCSILVLLSFFFVYKKSDKWVIIQRFGASSNKSFRNSYWYGIELIRRALVLIIVTLFPSSTVAMILCLMLLLTLYGYMAPHKKTIHNITEVMVLLWLILLLMLSINPHLYEMMIEASMNATSIPNCEDGVPYVTKLSVLLGVIYYIPGIIALLIFCLSIFKTLLGKLKEACKKKDQEVRDTDLYDTAYKLLDNETRRLVPSTELFNSREDSELTDRL